MLSLRLDTKTNEQLEYWSKINRLGKTDLIRNAIDDHLDYLEQGYEDNQIEEFIAGRMNEFELKKTLKWKEIPDDITQARKSIIDFKIEKIKKVRYD